ncbi:hypothetical protein ACFL5O_06725 [Myxococcota bacterium]
MTHRRISALLAPLGPDSLALREPNRGVVPEMTQWPSLHQVAFLVLVLPGCHLDVSRKTACGTAADCLDGYVCDAGVCRRSTGTSARRDSTHSVAAESELSAPSELTGGFAGSGYRLTWQDNSDREAGFRIQRKLDNELQFTEAATTDPNAASLVTELPRQGDYWFRVCAFSGDEQTCSDELYVRVAVPNKPSIAVQSDGTAVLVSWDPVDFQGPIDNYGYRIYGRQPCGLEFIAWQLVMELDPDAVEYRVSEWFPWDELAITAHNRYGESGYATVCLESD